jgi:hypothetical protein
VYFPKSDSRAVFDAVSRRHPIGSGYWGWNVDPEDRSRLYIDGEADLDLEAIVRTAVSDPSTVTVGPPPDMGPPNRTAPRYPQPDDA